MGALAGEVRAAPGADTLAARYGAARGFLGQEAHLSHPYRPRAVAANLLVRRTAFEQIGGFYEGVRAAEDTDFSWRLQAAGWKLELRRRAAVEHRYRTTIGDLRSQWRGYAAGRAWLGRRYQGFEPEPAVARASGRAWRRLRRKPADRRRTASREAIRVGRLERGGYAMLDAVLSAEELAGLMSNRPSGTRTPPARVVLIADRFPARGDPLAEFADTLDGARIEASARPESLEIGPVRSLPIAYREDDGVAARALAVLGLALAHPLRCAADRLGRAPDQPALAAIAPAVRTPAARPRRRRAPARRGHRGDRAANRAGLRAGGWPRDEGPRRRPLVVHAALRPRAVQRARAGRRGGRADHLPRSPTGPPPSPDGYVLREPFYRHALGPGGADAPDDASSPSTCPTCCATARRACGADVVHFQWLDVQWFDRYLLPARARSCSPPTTCCRASRAPARCAPSAGCTTSPTRSWCTPTTAVAA